MGLAAAALGVAGGLLYAIANAISDVDLTIDSGPAAQTRFDPAAMPGRTLVWSAPTRAGVSSPATIADGAVYVRDRRGRVQALDAGTGALRWSASAGRASVSGVDFAPVVVQGAVYVTGWDGVLHAFDSATGATRWTADLGTTNGLAPGGYPLAVADGIVYVNAKGISAFDATTGRARWNATTSVMREAGIPREEVATDAGLTSYSMPVVTGGRVYVGGNDGAVHALDAFTGASIWSSKQFPAPALGGNRSLSGIGPTSALTVANDVVYAAGRDGRLHALEAPSGNERWATPVGTPNDFGSAPVVSDGVVYVQTDALHALDAATGAARWVAPTGEGVSLFAFVPPVVHGGLVYVAGGDARLHEIDAATGASRRAEGRVPPPPELRPLFGPAVMAVAPARAGDVIYLGSGDHRVYAYPLRDTG